MDTQLEATKASPKTIHYFVNAEPQVTTDHTMTGREILERAGLTPAEDYRLTRADGGKEVAPDATESIHKDEAFIATYRGITPVS